MIYLYVLVAISVSDNPARQTLSYHATISECRAERNRVDSTINKTYIRLDCIRIKAINETKMD